MSKKILLVEDEMKVSKAYREHFERAGFEVIVANNGQEGLEQIKKNQPDIILLDVVMPLMDGLTMLKILKANEKTAEIPVIMLTNLDTINSIGEAMEAGIKNYLIKSNYSLVQLEEKVRDVLALKN